MDVFRILIIIVLLITVGLLVEKALHMSYSLKEVVYQFKADLKNLLTYFFTDEPVRHTFDPQMIADIEKVSEPYMNKSFEFDSKPGNIQGVPAVFIRFVPKNRSLEADELMELSNLILLKFRRYQTIYNLNWKSFVTYTTDSNYVYFNLLYAEFKEDLKAYSALHQRCIKEKSDIDYGVLTDNDLNKELEDVN